MSHRSVVPSTDGPLRRGPVGVGVRGWFLMAFAGALLSGCIASFLGEDAENTPESNFEVFWSDMDRYYALFDLKGISWDSLYALHRPEITPASSDEHLFDVMCAAIAPLRDIHVVIQNDRNVCLSEEPSVQDDLALRVVERIIGNTLAAAANGRLQYGQFTDGGKRLGYVHIKDFAGDGNPVAAWADDIDDVLSEMGDVDGLLLDVRSNSGGNGFNAVEMAGRFTDVRRPYLVTRTRNGVGHSDFTAPRTWYVEPARGAPFLKPVALLTNRLTFSAAEWFVLAMKTMPHVTHIGAPTGGGLSSRLFRTLPNGWTFSVSIQQVGSPDGAFYERTGIEPDILVVPNQGAVVRPDVIFREGIRSLLEMPNAE